MGYGFVYFSRASELRNLETSFNRRDLYRWLVQSIGLSYAVLSSLLALNLKPS